MGVSFPTRAVILLGLLMTTGCAGLSGAREQAYTCPYDTVWPTVLEAMQAYPVTSSDKLTGQIETNWADVAPLTEQTFGIFGREGFGNRERARMSVVVKRAQDAASVSVLETRQRWHARGGATSQAAKWWPIDPSQDATNDVVNRINTKLKEQGCPVT